MMAKFLFLFRSTPEAHYKMTPEQMQQNHTRWVKWLGDGVQKGWVADVGDGLGGDSRVVNPAKMVTDGPFMEAKEVVGGFTIVEAENIDQAAELAKGCPSLDLGGTVEVRPLWGFSRNTP
ncbi:MAG: YciI family protein [Bryobacteraceae bacterium]|nr:YciI family protein [Bryobacteraceae bacterium]